MNLSATCIVLCYECIIIYVTDTHWLVISVLSIFISINKAARNILCINLCVYLKLKIFYQK
jgi:hypothetical protein